MIGFLRPRLGIGGSERLALDAAMQLQRRGCRVEFFVPQGQAVPEFPEVTDASVAVQRIRTWLPEHIGGRLRAPLAIGRTAAAVRALAASCPDLIFCDVVSHVVPRVKRLTRRPVAFFCHFPDLLLTPEASRASLGYRLYRRPWDRLEVRGLQEADRVLVNSAYTASMVRATFPEIATTPLVVVHPGVPVNGSAGLPPVWLDEGEIALVSINRFDPRKNLELAIEALASMKALVAPALFERVRLVMAGRYDETLPEQRVLLEDLRRRADQSGVAHHVQFVLSPTSVERDKLLARSRAVVYTPAAEHFGYGPIEAMASARPVVAVSHGGPTETIINGTTGLLCPPDPRAFAEAFSRLATDAEYARAMGLAGRDHVARHFSLDAFGARLWDVIRPMLRQLAPTGA